MKKEIIEKIIQEVKRNVILRHHTISATWNDGPVIGRDVPRGADFSSYSVFFDEDAFIKKMEDIS